MGYFPSVLAATQIKWKGGVEGINFSTGHLLSLMIVFDGDRQYRKFLLNFGELQYVSNVGSDRGR